MEKSRRWHSDKRNLKKVWQDEFLFTEVKSKAVCLVCKQSVAVLKEYNIRRHYETKHSAAFSKYNGEERKKKANELLAKLRSEQRYSILHQHKKAPHGPVIRFPL